MGTWALSKGTTYCGYDRAPIPAGEPFYTVDGTTLRRCRSHAPRALLASDLDALVDAAERLAIAEASTTLTPSQFVARARVPAGRRVQSFTSMRELAAALPFDGKAAASGGDR
jgi:hypothetical protein